MKIRTGIRAAVFAAFLPVFFLSVLSAPMVRAEETAIDVKGDSPIQSTLVSLVGKDVILRLRSGQEIAGKLADAGKAAVRVSQLKGMEFFDAVVRVEDISAVVIRTK